MGESCFNVNIGKNSKYNTGFQVQLRFRITQHVRDEQLMRNLIEYLGCGNVNRRSREESVDYLVTRFEDIYEKIIPFFAKYPVLGGKIFRLFRLM